MGRTVQGYDTSLRFFSVMVVPESSGSRSLSSKPKSGVHEGPCELPCKGKASSVSCTCAAPLGSSRNKLEKTRQNVECLHLCYPIIYVTFSWIHIFILYHFLGWEVHKSSLPSVRIALVYPLFRCKVVPVPRTWHWCPLYRPPWALNLLLSSSFSLTRPHLCLSSDFSLSIPFIIFDIRDSHGNWNSFKNVPFMVSKKAKLIPKWLI